MENIMRMGLDLDSMGLDRHLIEEGLHLEKKQEEERVQLEQRQDLVLTILT